LKNNWLRRTVFRLTYTGKHGVNADQLFEINPQPNDYVYYTLTQKSKPTGTFANVALRIYDQDAYTSVRILQKSGYINTSIFTAQIERRFSKGLGFQAFYTLTNALREAGNSFRDDVATAYHRRSICPAQCRPMITTSTRAAFMTATQRFRNIACAGTGTTICPLARVRNSQAKRRASNKPGRRLEVFRQRDTAQYLVRAPDRQLGRVRQVRGLRQEVQDSRLPRHAYDGDRSERRTLYAGLSMVQRLHFGAQPQQ
jgi:hypothetical protein